MDNFHNLMKGYEHSLCLFVYLVSLLASLISQLVHYFVY